ncbi:MAG TPA: GAF domain-containing sensor histidine kinase [Gemmatimonadales bacterium]|nr:GAF domain-containing sensor histidine kinase [Gemmatimonadales bacterium]
MQYAIPPATSQEFSAGALQALVALALALLCLHLALRYHRAYFRWWAAAWTLYLARILCILSFLSTQNWTWLYWHQVVTGWTALAILYAALVFSRNLHWSPRHAFYALFPPVWSYIAIYAMRDFFWAALPMVLFLSFATVWTGRVFLQYRRRVGGSAGATVLAVTFLLWGVHHLDYPVLRARGTWVPWGYYVDVLFFLGAGSGILLLVLDELRRGLAALSALSGDLQQGGAGDRLDALLGRPLSLPGVRGSALVRTLAGGEQRVVRGAGGCAGWTGVVPPGPGATAIRTALDSGRPEITNQWSGEGVLGTPNGYVAILPVFSGARATGALLIAGEARDPFAVLDTGFLVALGHQVGTALEYDGLTARLQARTAELERLSSRMVRLHEDERRRLSRELHDETAQVLSAVKMQLGLLRERSDPDAVLELDRALALLDAGIRGIRSLTNDLRPSLLDDLGLLPALRSLTAEFAGRSGTVVEFRAPEELPGLSAEAELAIFRALQEALANVARHAGAQIVKVDLVVAGDGLSLDVVDDGPGFSGVDLGRLEQEGHMGLVGMRERIAALGGKLELSGEDEGARVHIEVPLPRNAGTSR